MHRRARSWAVATAGLMLLLTFSTPAAQGVYSATLDLDPTSGVAGASVTADGSGHTPNGTDIEIRWESEAGRLVGVAITDSSGDYSTTITIPPDAAPGTYTVVACETTFVVCTEVDHEFAIGATTTFTVIAPPTTTTTITTVASTTPTETIPTQQVDVPDVGGFVSTIGIGDSGAFGPWGSPPDGFEPTLYLPRCAPPFGSDILDFDTDVVGRQPALGGHPSVASIPQLVEAAPSGSITPRQAIHASGREVRQVVSFISPQQFVGLYVGDEADSGSRIELVALNAGGSIVAVDRISSAHRPVDTCMAVRVAGDPSISRVIILTDPSASIFFDRLFYSAIHDMPISPRAERGTVEFIRPTNGAELSARVRQLVLGTIRIPAGLTIDDVMLSVPHWDRSAIDIRHIDFYPLWVEGDEQLYSFVGSGIYVPEGRSYLGVTATGTGVVASGLIEVVGTGPSAFELALPELRIDIQPVTLEVTQAIRGPVQLIAPGTIVSERDDTVLVQNKKTVVRAFARLVPAAGGTFSGTLAVNAELVGTRDGVVLPGSPLAPVRGLTTLGVYPDAAAAYHDAKQRTDGSWNFVLPDSWTDPGSIDLRLEVNSPLIFGHIDEAPGLDGVLNLIQVDDVVFRSKNAPAVDIWLVDYYYKCAGLNDTGGRIQRDGQGSSPTPAWTFCTGLAEGDVTHAQPTSSQAINSVLQSWNMAPFPGGFPTRFDVWEYTFATDGVSDEQLEPGPLITPGSPQERFWLGVALRMDVIVGSDGYNTLSALMTSFVRGQAWGSPSFFRITPTPVTFLHEAAHTMGVRHTGDAHGESNEISRWIDDHGQIGRDAQSVSAFDTNVMQALPYLGRHDLMSYGPNRWTSWDVWKHIEDAVGSGFARPDHRNHADLSATGARAPAGSYDGAPPQQDDAEVVTISASLTEAGVAYDPSFHLAGGIVADDGAVVVRILGGDGALLSEWSTPLLEAYFEGAGATEQGFTIPVWVPPDAAEMVILLDGEEIDRRSVVAAPSVGAIDGLPDGPLVDTVQLSWGVEGGSAEQYLVEVSQDGERWYPLALTGEPHATIEPAAFPFQGPGWRLRVQASSGTAISISPEVTIDFAERAAAPMIALPIDGSTVASNTFMDLQAVVSRFSMGDEAQLVWDVDGVQAAVGPTGLTVAGEPGTHVVTLTSPSGEAASATITVVADSDLDGLPDAWETQWGFDPQDPTDGLLDGDADGVPAWQEAASGSSPESVDTDGDDYADGIEIAVGTDPADPDSFPSVGLDGSAAQTISGANDVEGGLPTPVILLVFGLGGLLLATAIIWLGRRRT